MKPFLAMISPVTSGAHPDHELPKPPGATTPPGQPPRPDQTLPGDLPHPEHPIYWPLPPGAPVDPEYGIPEDGPHPDHTLPGAQPRPDHDLPGAQPHPEHPIVLPPDSGGWKPVYIWGPTDPRPTPPIVLPPGGTVDVGGDKLKVIPIWTPENGWETIVVLKPQGAHVTPSKRK